VSVRWCAGGWVCDGGPGGEPAKLFWSERSVAQHRQNA